MAEDPIDLLKFDAFAATDSELKAHITRLREFRLDQAKYVNVSVNEANFMLEIAKAELRDRSSRRLSLTAILISLLAVIATAIGAFV